MPVRVGLCSIALALVLAPAPAMARREKPMTVVTFLAIMDVFASNKRRHVGFVTKDLSRLQKALSDGLKAVHSANTQSSTGPVICPPGGFEKYEFTSKEIMPYFQAMPPERRGIQVAAAVVDYMRQAYPCPVQPPPQPRMMG
jgi:hypothetical protein